MNRRGLEIAVGGAMFVAAAIFLVFAFTGGRLGGPSGYLLHARFSHVDGISVGSAVLIGGLKVGQVTSLTLDRKGYKPVISMRIREGVRIPVDSGALILSDGLLGDKFIKIEPGSEDEFFADGGEFEHVQDSVILERILDRIVREAEARRGVAKRAPK